MPASTSNIMHKKVKKNIFFCIKWVCYKMPPPPPTPKRAIDFFWLGRWFGRWPVAGGWWPVGRWPEAGGRWPVAGGRWRWPEAGGRGRWPVAGGRWPEAGGRWPVLCMFRLLFLIFICFFSMALFNKASLFDPPCLSIWNNITDCLKQDSLLFVQLLCLIHVFKPPWLSGQTCVYNQAYLFN